MILRLIGLLVFGGALAAVYFFESSSHATGIMRIFHWPAMVLTGVGPLGLIMICTDWESLRDTVRLMFGKSPAALRKLQRKETELLHQVGQKFYSDGVKAFDGLGDSKLSPYLKKTFKRLSVKMSVKDVKNMLEREKARTVDQFHRATGILSMAVRLAPSVGMLGTILGMVQLLESLKDPSQIGAHMSLALLTTFFGLFFSLAVWTPTLNRLQSVFEVTQEGYDQGIHWLSLLEERKPAEYFAETQAKEIKKS